MIPRSMLYDSSVPSDAKLVYLMLSSHAGGEAMSWPSHKRMAAGLGISVSQVKRMLAWLRDAGYVTWDHRHRDDGSQSTCEYTLLITSKRTPASAGGSVVAMGGSGGAGGGSQGAPPSPQGATPQSTVSGGVAHGELPMNESQLNESQRTIAAAPRLTGIDGKFEQFWSIYPRKEAKAAAKAKFAIALRRGVELETLLAGARRYRDDPNRDPQFTAHPTTWLNQGRWDDEPLPARDQASPRASAVPTRPQW